jgi:di/tricarboxylate transporter
MRSTTIAQKDLTIARKRISLFDTKDERNKVAAEIYPCFIMLFLLSWLILISIFEEK